MNEHTGTFTRKLYPYVTQCKRYKKSLGVLFVLGGIAIGWGIFLYT